MLTFLKIFIAFYGTCLANNKQIYLNYYCSVTKYTNFPHWKTSNCNSFLSFTKQEHELMIPLSHQTFPFNQVFLLFNFFYFKVTLLSRWQDKNKSISSLLSAVTFQTHKNYQRGFPFIEFSLSIFFVFVLIFFTTQKKQSTTVL